jgi:hypothetical protein
MMISEARRSKYLKVSFLIEGGYWLISPANELEAVNTLVNARYSYFENDTPDANLKVFSTIF